MASAITAAAHCIGRCDWTTGPGPWPDVDRAADKHTRDTRHPTATVATPTRKVPVAEEVLS